MLTLAFFFFLNTGGTMSLLYSDFCGAPPSNPSPQLRVKGKLVQWPLGIGMGCFLCSFHYFPLLQLCPLFILLWMHWSLWCFSPLQFNGEIIDIHHSINLRDTARWLDFYVLWNDYQSRFSQPVPSHIGTIKRKEGRKIFSLWWELLGLTLLTAFGYAIQQC